MYQGQLIIKPVAAQLTYSTEWIGKMDCYCKIVVGGNVFQTRPAHDQDKHPNWQEAFTARVNGEQSMQVTLLDKDNVTRDDYVGEATINIAQVYQTRQSSNWYPVMRRGRNIGQIMIIMEFYPQGGMGQMGGMGMGMGMPNMGMGGMGMGGMGGMGMGGMPNMGMGGMGMGGMGMGNMGMGGMGGYGGRGGMGMGGMGGMGGYGGMGGMGGYGGYGY